MFQSKNKNYIIAIFFLFISFSFFIIYFSPFLNTSENREKRNNDFEEKKETEVVFKIEKTSLVTQISADKTIYELMQKLKEDKKINFTSKTFPGLGEFVEEINGLKNANGKYWILYINNQKAEIGISNYKLKNKDIISWHYE